MVRVGDCSSYRGVDCTSFSRDVTPFRLPYSDRLPFACKSDSYLQLKPLEVINSESEVKSGKKKRNPDENCFLLMSNSEYPKKFEPRVKQRYLN